MGTLRLRSRLVKPVFTEFFKTETGALPVGVFRAQFARFSVGHARRAGPDVQLAEAAAARIWVAGVSGVARDW